MLLTASVVLHYGGLTIPALVVQPVLQHPQEIPESSDWKSRVRTCLTSSNTRAVLKPCSVIANPVLMWNTFYSFACCREFDLTANIQWTRSHTPLAWLSDSLSILFSHAFHRRTRKHSANTCCCLQCKHRLIKSFSWKKSRLSCKESLWVSVRRK